MMFQPVAMIAYQRTKNARRCRLSARGCTTGMSAMTMPIATMSAACVRTLVRQRGRPSRRGGAREGGADAERDHGHALGVDPRELARLHVLRERTDGAAEERVAQEQLEPDEDDEPGEEDGEPVVGERDVAELDDGFDVGGS